MIVSVPSSACGKGTIVADKARVISSKFCLKPSMRFWVRRRSNAISAYFGSKNALGALKGHVGMGKNKITYSGTCLWNCLIIFRNPATLISPYAEIVLNVSTRTRYLSHTAATDALKDTQSDIMESFNISCSFKHESFKICKTILPYT